MTTENSDPFAGRAHGNLVFRDPRDRLFYIGRWSPRQRKEWLRDHPERWQTREDALRDLQARAGTDIKADIKAEPPESCSTTSANGAESDGPVPGEDKWLSDRPAPNTTPPTIANAEATAATAGDEIIIDERRLISELRFAAMLGYSPRTLQRWRNKHRGPPSTKIGRRFFYEIDEVQEWIEEKKSR